MIAMPGTQKITPETFSALHRMPGTEIFHFYLGDPVVMLQLLRDGTSQTITIGPDLAAGQRPQVVVRGHVWQGSKLLPGGKWALLGTTMAPGFDYKDFELGNRDELAAQYPGVAEMIRQYTREKKSTCGFRRRTLIKKKSNRGF